MVFPFYPLSFQNHHSFTAVDPCLGPLVLSVCLEEEENRLRVILRSFSFSSYEAERRMMCEERSRLESPSADPRPQFNRSTYRRNLIIWQLVGKTIIKQQVWCGKKKSLHVRSWALNVFYSLDHSTGNVCFQVKCTFVSKYMRTFASGFIAFEHDCSTRCNRTVYDVS